GRGTTGGADKDIRLFRVIDNTQQSPALIADNGLPNYAADGDFFTLEISGTEGSSLVSLRILDPNGAVYFNNPSFDLGEVVPAGSSFGITTWSSGNSIFDDFGLALANGPRSVMLSFDSGSGDLSGDPDWSLAIAGNSGADFVFEANPFAGGTGMVIDAPPGGQPPLAVYDPIALGAGEAFQVSIETGFAGAGVYGGLVFDYQNNDNFLSFELADGSTAATQGRLFRIRRRSSGSDENLVFPDAGTLPTASRNKFYRLTVEGNTGDTEISYAIRDVATDSLLASGTIDLPAAVAAGSKFGIIAQSSGASKFDNLSIETTP
ncbi:MAG: hypothetical protein KDN05_22495, partial [Verrucomicrobiae bacterium]|nr:hypothetical protein [Verrucomicrobiae bacterium]